MSRLWLILLTLTLARMTMGVQFQSVGALGPALLERTGLSHAELGTLIGIYLLPGVLFAIPGGWLGARFGDKRVVLAGMTAMIIGGALLVVSSHYPVLLLGRLLSGLGAVLLNVLVTKMVADWFAGRSMAFAMGVLVTSWPLGIALALVVMGPLASGFGIPWSFLLPVVACTVATILVATIYSAPPGQETSGSPSGGGAAARLTPRELAGVVLAGGVWCLYNVALILPLSFGAEYLVSRGTALSAAGPTVSLTSWFIIPALALGGWAADRIGRPMTIMLTTFTLIAAVNFAIPWLTYPALVFALLGILFGPGGGLVMALPSRVLQPANRALGMGIFFAIYYGGMGAFPALTGYLRDLIDDPAIPFMVAGAAICGAMLALIGFRALENRP